MEVFKLKYKKIDNKAYPPSKKYELDAGIDLYCLEDIDWSDNHSFWTVLVRTGISIEVPPGYHLGTAPRSSMLFGKQIGTYYSVIDTGYMGEITFLLHHWGKERPSPIKRGDKIAQVIPTKNMITSIEFEEVDELPNHSPRKFSGFGSTNE